MIVNAISPKNKKLNGIVVNAFGMYADNASSALVKKINTHSKEGTVDIIDNITHYFKNQNDSDEDCSPEGNCPLCWGRQQSDGKIRKLLKDKQVDVNNHKDSYMLIQKFMKHNIDGIKLKEGVVSECPTCSDELNKNDNENDY